ncbi:MoaD/ThiS family protein [Dokdonia ponticola]|uniref:MoaD/ThiS family protein n=1 Tax=Dokdonia ponticola TaxID=2041041 RepID=A0ABV9I3M8_9FLAO
MKITLHYHGQLTTLFGKTEEPLDVASRTVAGLKKELEVFDVRFRESTYQLAQNNKIINGNTEITEGRMDVFPPFSGG